MGSLGEERMWWLSGLCDRWMACPPSAPDSLCDCVLQLVTVVEYEGCPSAEALLRVIVCVTEVSINQGE